MTAKELISKLDDVARERCHYEYGLPIGHDEDEATMLRLVAEYKKSVADRICTFIEEQNAMVNTLLGEKNEPGRHDAFVRDIVRAIREGKPNG